MVQANVLVTGVGSIIGQGIIKALKLSNLQKSSPVTYRVFAADMSPQAAGLYRCDKAFLIPSATSDDHYENISRICKENEVRALFVGTDEEATSIAPHKDRLKKETGTVLLNSPEEVIRIAADKWSTYQFLKKNKISCAKSALPDDKDGFVKELGFPFVVKPREGHGSLHFYVVRNNDELKYAISSIEGVGWKPILQEYLDGTNNEFTSGITVDKDRRSIMSSISMRKILKSGQTYKAFIDDFDSVRRSAQEVAVKIGASGPINVQAKEIDGESKVFELNARFSATCPFRAAAGINEPDIVFRNVILAEKIKVSSYQKLVCMRYWNEVYVPVSTYEKLYTLKSIQKPGSNIPDYF